MSGIRQFENCVLIAGYATALIFNIIFTETRGQLHETDYEILSHVRMVAFLCSYSSYLSQMNFKVESGVLKTIIPIVIF